MIDRLSIICIATIVFLVTLPGCTDKKPPLMIQKESSEYSFTSFTNSIDQYPYEAPKAKQDIVKNGYSKVSLGMNKQDIKQLMGEPDAEFFSYNVRKGSEIFTNSTWGYYLHRHEKTLATSNYDRAIFLDFDTIGKLYWAGWSVPGGDGLFNQIGDILKKDSNKSANKGMQTDAAKPRR
jgi:hypothetical protein